MCVSAAQVPQPSLSSLSLCRWSQQFATCSRAFMLLESASEFAERDRAVRERWQGRVQRCCWRVASRAHSIGLLGARNVYLSRARAKGLGHQPCHALRQLQRPCDGWVRAHPRPSRACCSCTHMPRRQGERLHPVRRKDRPLRGQRARHYRQVCRDHVRCESPSLPQLAGRAAAMPCLTRACRCRVCKHYALERELARSTVCPLCHALRE